MCLLQIANTSIYDVIESGVYPLWISKSIEEVQPVLFPRDEVELCEYGGGSVTMGLPSLVKLKVV